MSRERDWTAGVAQPRDGDPPPLARVVVVFDARYAGGDPRPEPGEISDVGWFTSPPPADALRYPAVADYFELAEWDTRTRLDVAEE